MVDLPAAGPVRGLAATQHSQPRSLPIGATHKSGKDVAGENVQQVVSLASELSSEPAPVDHERIAQVRAALSSGTYRVDPEEIARAILGNR